MGGSSALGIGHPLLGLEGGETRHSAFGQLCTRSKSMLKETQSSFGQPHNIDLTTLFFFFLITEAW